MDNFEKQKAQFDDKNKRLELELQNKDQMIKNLKNQLEDTKNQNLTHQQKMKKIQDDLEKQLSEISTFKQQEKKLQQKLEEEEQSKEKVKDEKETLLLESRKQIQILNGEKNRMQLQYEELQAEKA